MSNKWKTYIFKAILLVVVLILVDFLYGVLCRSMEKRSVNKNRTNFVAEYTMWYVDADAVVIGASEAQHSYVSKILADSIGMSVYNCGEDGQFFYYQNAMINGILDRYSPKLIIWSVQPSFLSFNPAAKERISALKPFARDNEYCYEMLKIKSRYEPLKIKSNCYVFNSTFAPYILTCVSSPIVNNNFGWVPSGKAANLPEIKDADYVNEIDEKCLSIFDSTLLRLKQEGVEVVFVFTPSYEVGVYDTLESYRELMQVADKYGYPIVEELYHHETLMYSQLFRDNMHLNRDGAILFSTMLAEKIKQIRR